MSYGDLAGVKRLLKKLTTSDVSDADVAIELDRVDAIIDACMGLRFDVPFIAISSEYPPIIVTIAEELCVYRVGRIIYTNHQPKINQWIDGFKKSAIEKMDMVLDGLMVLIDANGTTLTMTSTGFKVSPNDVESLRIFGMDEYYHGMRARRIGFSDYDKDNL